MTDNEAGKLITYLQCAGLEPKPAQMQSPEMTKRVYAGAFTRADVGFEEAMAAVVAYVEEPHMNAGGFPKAFPDPGALLARTPAAKMAARFGADLDVDRAWLDFQRRIRGASRNHTTEQITEALSDSDSARSAAILAAFRATGGRRWFDEADAHTERRWRDAYRAERREQSHDPRVVRAALVMVAQRAFPVAVAK